MPYFRKLPNPRLRLLPEALTFRVKRSGVNMTTMIICIVVVLILISVHIGINNSTNTFSSMMMVIQTDSLFIISP